ncbi:YciI family protein [Paracoccus seriniphilus]|uniref:YciI family protein n=1 Tax=Paracoccus seriniphilus TaxID=184748 RepID=UPI003562D1A8
MPLFAVTCRDKPGALQIRLDTREAHLEYLKNSDIVFMAGPLLEEGEMRGSLVVLDTEDMASAQAWVDGDPYGHAGLFQSVEIREWKKVIG